MERVEKVRQDILMKSRVKSHSVKCKICNLPERHLEYINRMLLNDITDGNIIAYADEMGFELNEMNISDHRKFLPFLIDDDLVERVVQRAKAIDGEGKAGAISDMEKRIADIEQGVQEYQEGLKLTMWGGTIPSIVERIQQEATDGVVPVRDLAYALDLVMKNAFLLTGGATERTEVLGDDGRSKEVASFTSSIEATLKAIDRANETIASQDAKGGKS